MLAHYDTNKETVLMTDSSKYATGSVVFFRNNKMGDFKPVSIASREFNHTEGKRSIRRSYIHETTEMGKNWISSCIYMGSKLDFWPICVKNPFFP
jgi:hypothetical protein